MYTVDQLKEVKASDRSPRLYQRHKRAGYLLSPISLNLHSPEAQMLFKGNAPECRTGLLLFSKGIVNLWQAAEHDDPYADEYLLSIYEAMIDLQGKLSGDINHCQQQIRTTYQNPQLVLAPFVAKKPLSKNLRFSHQYGYLGANLLASVDELICQALTAECIGILWQSNSQAIRSTYIPALINLFKTPYAWKKFPATRQDVIDNTPIAQQANNAMQKPSQRILDKSARSPFAPEIIKEKS